MIVTTWKNSSSGYGIRISYSDFSRVEKWREILIEGSIDMILREKRLRRKRIFKIECPEIRSVLIRDFLKKNGLLNWPPGLPYRLKLQVLKNGRFKLTSEQVPR